jgi:DNA-binding NarL/FixJ family response regulator
MSRIFLLLNDPLVAGRMRALVDATPGLQTVGWVATMDQARAQLPSLQADLVLTDIQLADGWVAGLVDELSTSVRYGRPKVLVVTLSLDDSQLIDALVRGADGYFVQGQSPQSLIAAIEQTLAGGAEMAPGIARQVKAHFDAAAWKRSDRLDDENPLHPDRLERQVLQWTCDGFLPHEIARDLRISTREVALRVRREAEVEVAQRTAHGHVGQREVVAEHQGLSPRPWLMAFSAACTRTSGGRSRPGSAVRRCARPRWLPGAPARRRRARRRPAPPRCAPRCARGPDGGISLPTGDRVSRYSTMTRESNTASPPSITRQGTLPSGLASARLAAPDVLEHELEVELLLGHHDAHLAHVGAGERTDEFHVLLCLLLWGRRPCPNSF